MDRTTSPSDFTIESMGWRNILVNESFCIPKSNGSDELVPKYMSIGIYVVHETYTDVSMNEDIEYGRFDASKLNMSNVDEASRFFCSWLNGMEVPEDVQRELMAKLLLHSRWYFGTTIINDKQLPVFEFKVVIRTWLVDDEEEDVARAVEESTEDYTIQTIPAAKSAIDELEEIELERSHPLTSETCVICLGRFKVGMKVKCMPKPCSHMFHVDCIVEWLETSHTCPSCRFKMPTEEDVIQKQLSSLELR